MDNVDNIAEELKERRRLRQMRLGQDAPELYDLPNDPDVRIALVPLNEAENEMSMIEAAMLDLPENQVALSVRDRHAMLCDLALAIRQPNDVTKRVFKSPQDVKEALHPMDVNYLGEMYTRMMDWRSPALDGMNDEQLEELKKAFAVLDLSVLSGKAWWHLSNFFSEISVEHVRASFFGSTSTSSLTTTSEDETLTQSAETS